MGFNTNNGHLLKYTEEPGVTAVEVPAGIFFINEGAFDGCSSLEHITIGEGVRYLDENALGKMDNLKSISFPSTVIDINGKLFLGCRRLVSVEVSPQHPRYISLDGVLYTCNDKRVPLSLHAWPPAKKHVCPRKGILAIDEYAFCGCRSNRIRLPDGTAYIAENAFYSCQESVHITFPRSIRRFSNQDGLSASLHYRGTKEQWHAVIATDRTERNLLTSFGREWLLWCSMALFYIFFLVAVCLCTALIHQVKENGSLDLDLHLPFAEQLFGSDTAEDTPAAEVNPAASIPDDAMTFNGHFYYIYDDAESWSDAMCKCEALGGHLATLTTQEENDAVYSYMEENDCGNAFFGLYNGGYYHDQTWLWVTGEPFDYANWDSSQPDSYCDEGDYYADFINGGWGDDTYTAVNTYICEWDEYVPASDSWITEFNGHYYDIYPDAESWTDAKEKAEAMGGHLVCITSREEDDFLLSLMHSMGYWYSYIGLYNDGQDDNGEYTFAWVSGEDVTFTDWADGQPDCADGTELYGSFASEGFWNDVNDESLTGYIIEWDSVDQILITDPKY